MKKKSSLIAASGALAVHLAVYLVYGGVLGWFAFPDPTTRYEGFFGAWFYGGVHGHLSLANLIWGAVRANHFAKASDASTAYGVWWYIACLFLCFWFVKTAIAKFVVNALTNLAAKE